MLFVFIFVFVAVLGIGMACAVTALPILVSFLANFGLLRQPLGQRILPCC